MGEREFGRAERVALQLRKELAWVLEREMQDPRTHMVTISRVEVSRDLSHARVYVSAPEDHPIAEVLKALNHAAGYLQMRLGERIRMRYLPRLRFQEDKALEKASRIDALLAEVKSRRR
ncbi:MAG TPA: 30S ribosome-binding factor RbfA [Gammaproteobacteria bacterium]|nr:30S ribosome-binding factor RbfA [Gammaproteobacteria bacterium]